MADAIKLAHAVLHALWAEEKNTGDPATLQAIIAGCGLDADAVMKAGEAPETAAKREAYTKARDRPRRVRRAVLRDRRRDLLGPGPARLRRAQAGVMTHWTARSSAPIS